MRFINNKTLLFALIAFAGLYPAIDGECFAKTSKKADEWQARENMASRFGSEWYKIEVLNRELSGIADVLDDIKDLELFPSTLTGLEKASLVRFDRKIDRMEKLQARLQSRVNEFRTPLLDAMAILREMVVGEPVESMFEVLEQGDMSRISEMLRIKHEIDTLWSATDTLLTSVMEGIGAPPEKPRVQGGFEEDFFAIIKANLGMQSERYYQKLNIIKNTLVNRAAFNEIKDMYTIETARIKKYLKEDKLQLAQQKMADATARYDGKIDISELNTLGAKTAILRKDYGKTLVLSNKLANDGKPGALKQLYRMQSLYALQRYDTLWQESAALDYSKFSDTARNLVIWMSMESALAMKKKDVYVKLASFIERKAPYAVHAMHTLGRSYLVAGDPTTALSVFESALKFEPRSAMDQRALREVHNAVAQTNYELGHYDKALTLFFEQLNNQEDFTRSLYGILWCYLSLGQNDKAETTLRKLINQSPESHYAADAFLVLAQRYLSGARNDWKIFQYLAGEEQRIKDLLVRLQKKHGADTTTTRDSLYAVAKGKLELLLKQLQKEPRKTYEEIASGYDNVGRIGDLIQTHYATGSFQTVVFTEKRAELLSFLDSCMKSASAVREQAVATVSNRRAAADAIRKVVIQSTGFCTEAIIEKSRFEQQYLDLEKTALNAREKELLRPLFERTDSTARKEVEAIKKKFSAQLDSLIALEDNRKKQYNRNMTSRLESLLVTDLDSVNAAYFHYQLAELYYADENSSYLRNYEKFDKDRMVYEQKLTAYRDGRILEPPVEPIAPIIDHLASGAEFTTALALSPPPEIAAAAHYGLAWCYNDAGATDSALQQMRTVASGFPASKFAAQAWMYIGEYLFDKNDLPAAIQCYQSVMKYPESEWFEEALYKLAWSQYRLSNPEKAISSFLALVSLGSGTGDKTKMLLEKESMDYIAISFSESDLTGPRGLDRAAAFAKKLGDPDRGSQILHRLASVYSDQGRYDMARHTYTTLLKMNPSYRNIVGVESELMAIKDRDASPEEISRLKVEFFKSYNSKSTWAKNQTDPENIVKADNLAEGQLYEAAIGYHQLALQKNDAAVYATALSTYSDYIRHYPSSRRASECHYNLAELEFSLGDYQKAAEDYLAVSKRYPDSKFRETAAWNAIVASQNLVKKEVSAQ